MMAIEIAQGTVDDNGAYFRVEKHEWDFEDYREDRTFKNAPTRHPISSDPEIRKKSAGTPSRLNQCTFCQVLFYVLYL